MISFGGSSRRLGGFDAPGDYAVLQILPNSRHYLVDMAKTQQLSDNSWLVDVATVNKDTWDLSVNNPNRIDVVDSRTPQEIIAEIELLDAQAAEALQAIRELL